VVGCFAFLVALLAGAPHPVQPQPPMLIVPGFAPDGSAAGLDPRALLDMPPPTSPGAWGGKPFPNQENPPRPLPGPKTPPCDAAASQEEINGGCWVGLARKPPCGIYFRRGDQCYAPVSAPKKP